MERMTAPASSEVSPAEAERQLAAAAARHREAVTSMQEPGRPEAGRHVAAKSVGRAVHLVSYALGRAAAAGVPPERLGGFAGGGPGLRRGGTQPPGPPPRAP